MSIPTTTAAALTSTLDALTAAQLIAYYQPPAPLSTVLQQPSTDPAVYMMDPDYIKLLNKQMYWKYAVDVPNGYAASDFAWRCKTWEMGAAATNADGSTSTKKSLFLPAPPSYVYFDQNAFDQWWTQLQGDRTAQEAPPLFFVKPYPNPPSPVIISASAPPPPAPAVDGPIGAAVPNNPGVFQTAGAPADNFPDGYIYAGPTGVYQKHIYSNPFTAGNTRVIWVELGTYTQIAA